MHLSPAHKDAAIRLLDRRPAASKTAPPVEAGMEADKGAAEKGRESK